ncbi:hypothetical protein [Endozoicomonas sp. 4G]|uniref:hypothetical protein n=1 Tax=Endozoicomonas sp. 4G TaxID=2872754 RepID=UPI00207895B0|nr:hypothetical protein [Endozoicomonas sp. 4G]
MAQARNTLIDPGSTPYYHCMARCVRQAYLCGENHLTGKNYEHRRQWVVDKLRELVSVFAIEVCAYAVMSNHYQKPFCFQGQNTDVALPYLLHDYLELVDWSGRTVRTDKKGSIPSCTPPILQRLGIDPDEWLKTMQWNNRFYRAVGRLEAMKNFALEAGQKWLQGLNVCSRLYQTG